MYPGNIQKIRRVYDPESPKFPNPKQVLVTGDDKLGSGSSFSKPEPFSSSPPRSSLSCSGHERTTDRAGELIEHTDWHKVKVFGGPAARFVEKYVHTGSHLLVTGARFTTEPMRRTARSAP